MIGFNVINFIKLSFFFFDLVSASDTLLDVDDARGNVGVHRCVFRVFNYFQWRDMVSAKNSLLYLNQAFLSLTFLQCVDVLKVVKFHFYIQPARIYDRWAA